MDLQEIFKGALTPAKLAALGEYLQSSSISGGPGVRVRRVGNKTILTTRRAKIGSSVILPFGIGSSGTILRAAPGSIDAVTIAETTLESPASGQWYLEISVTINDESGAITTTTVSWVSAETADTSTVFHKTIGQSFVVDGEVDSTSNLNFSYGNYAVILHGTPTNKWGATIF